MTSSISMTNFQSVNNPLSECLHHGAILGGIVTAIKACEDVTFSTFRHWRSSDYLAYDGQGTDGVVSFVDGLIVGLVHTAHSDRNRARCHDPDSLKSMLFRGMPVVHRARAELLASTYLRMGNDERASFTTAFWDENGLLVAAESWDNVIASGGFIFDNELIEDKNLSMRRWENAIEMTPEQVTLSWRLYQRRVANFPQRIIMSEEEIGLLRSISTSNNTVDTVFRLLAEMDINSPVTGL